MPVKMQREAKESARQTEQETCPVIQGRAKEKAKDQKEDATSVEEIIMSEIAQSGREESRVKAKEIREHNRQ